MKRFVHCVLKGSLKQSIRCALEWEKRYEKCEKQRVKNETRQNLLALNTHKKIQLCDQELREAGRIMKRQGIRSFGDLFSPARSRRTLSRGPILKFKD